MLNSEAGDICDLEDLQLIRCTAEAVRQLNDNRLFYGLAPNQVGPARDYYSISHVEALLQRCSLLAAAASLSRGS